MFFLRRGPEIRARTTPSPGLSVKVTKKARQGISDPGCRKRSVGDGSGMANEKSPFEKVKSNLEAKRIYERLAAENIEFYCKGENAFFTFQSQTFDTEQGLRGQVLVNEGESPVHERVIVNFTVESDRYYTVSEFLPSGSEGLLIFSGPLYRLERREHYRVSLPESMQRDCNIINCAGKTVFVAAVILDISAGGARLQVLKGKLPGCENGQTLRAVLHLKKKWKIELDVEVRHLLPGQRTDVLGVRFIPANPAQGRQLVSVVMELQRDTLSLRGS